VTDRVIMYAMLAAGVVLLGVGEFLRRTLPAWMEAGEY